MNLSKPRIGKCASPSFPRTSLYFSKCCCRRSSEVQLKILNFHAGNINVNGGTLYAIVEQHENISVFANCWLGGHSYWTRPCSQSFQLFNQQPNVYLLHRSAGKHDSGRMNQKEQIVWRDPRKGLRSKVSVKAAGTKRGGDFSHS